MGHSLESYHTTKTMEIVVNREATQDLTSGPGHGRSYWAKAQRVVIYLAMRLERLFGYETRET